MNLMHQKTEGWLKSWLFVIESGGVSHRMRQSGGIDLIYLCDLPGAVPE